MARPMDKGRIGQVLATRKGNKEVAVLRDWSSKAIEIVDFIHTVLFICQVASFLALLCNA